MFIRGISLGTLASGSVAGRPCTGAARDPQQFCLSRFGSTLTHDIEDLGGREKLKRYPWPRMIACLATLAITLPLAAENPSRSSASHVDDRAGRFPFGSKLTLGLLGGFTLTPDYRTGFLGIDRVGTIKYEVETALGVPPLEVHDVHSASYSRPDSSRPILGAFAETALTYQCLATGCRPVPGACQSNRDCLERAERASVFRPGRVLLRRLRAAAEQAH